VGNNKQGYSFTLEEDNISWLDKQIEEKRWRSRSHAIDEFIRQAREKAANAGGEAVATNPQ
jgi:Arc/MetJ-type ribon-helix-helix transcriptional regulator